MKKHAFFVIQALRIIAVVAIVGGLFREVTVHAQSPGSAPAPRVSQLQGWPPQQQWGMLTGGNPQASVPCDPPGTPVPQGVIGMAQRWDIALVSAVTPADAGALPGVPIAGDQVFQCLVNSQGQYGWVRIAGAP